MTDRPVPEIPAFVAFAGGGAKGLVHVGALKALETRAVDIRGVAGTSAGAIVAALKASGFSADDMADPITGRTILDELARIDAALSTAPALFGEGGWARVARLRALLRCGLARVAVAAALSVTLLLLGSFLCAAMANVAAALILWGLWLATFGIVFRRIRAGLAGLSRLERFKGALGRVIAARAFPAEPDRIVRLRDFDGGHLLPLKIVGANLSTRQLTLFSAETTPDIAVADAVAASISIPIVFAPQRIGADVFVDGGIVSNLPAWPFDEERALDPDAVTLAFEIAEEVPENEELGGAAWLPAAIRTALFGSGILNLRAVGRSELITLRTDLDVLQFDLGRQAALRQVAESTIAADVELELRLFARPSLYRRACETMVRAVEDILAGLDGTSRRGAGPRRVRVSLAMPDDGHARSLRLRYGAGYDADLDERLLLPLDATVAGLAWTSGRAQFHTVPFPQSVALPGRPNRYRRQQVWRDMDWALCIPIFRRGRPDPARPAFIVSIDSNERPPDAVLDDFRDAVTGLAIDSFETLLVQLEQIGEGA